MYRNSARLKSALKALARNCMDQKPPRCKEKSNCQYFKPASLQGKIKLSVLQTPAKIKLSVFLHAKTVWITTSLVERKNDVPGFQDVTMPNLEKGCTREVCRKKNGP